MTLRFFARFYWMQAVFRSELNGLVAARQISKQNPKQQILILSVMDSEQVVKEAFAAGARGFVLKSDAARDLIAAVEALQRHRTFVPFRVQDMFHAEP